MNDIHENITAVITATNTRYIRTQLESVCEQLRDVIIVCDRNVPEMREIATEFDCTLIYTDSIGQGKARLAGVKQVRTEYVHVLDDDDWICRDFYVKPQADVMYTTNISVLDKTLHKPPAISAYSNISCHIVKTSIMLECLDKYQHLQNIGEDHFYYDFFSDYSIDEFGGAIMRILIKPRIYDKIKHKRELGLLINRTYSTSNDKYNQILNKYKEANRHAYNSMCE